VDAQTGRAFVANQYDDSVSVLDTRTGRVLRTVPVNPHPGAVAVDARVGHVFTLNQPEPEGISRASVSMLDAHSGRLLRTVPVDYSPAVLAVDERTSHVFISTSVVGTASTVSELAALYVLDSRTAEVLYTSGWTTGHNAMAVDATAGRVFSTEDSGDGGAGSVDVLDARTGQELRSVNVGVSPVAVAVDERTGRVFIANYGQGTVSVLEAGSGRLLRSVPVGKHPRALAVDAQSRRVFVASLGPTDQYGMGTGDGRVTMLDARSGQVVRFVRVDKNPRALAADTHTGRVFVVDVGPTDQSSNTVGVGRVRVLDAESGRVLNTVPVGQSPGAIAIDERFGHVFVTNYHDGTVSVLDASRL
jgi:YVTN family beta-propeller protein